MKDGLILLLNKQLMLWDIRNKIRKLINAITKILLLEHYILGSRFYDRPFNILNKDLKEDLKN